PTSADPAGDAGGGAFDEREGGDVLGHDGAGGDEGVVANGDAGDDGGIGANARALFDEGSFEGGLTGIGGTRPFDVGEDRRGGAADVALELGAGIEADVVLNPAAMAEAHALGDETALREDAALADDGAAHHVRKAPDARSRANGGGFFD